MVFGLGESFGAVMELVGTLVAVVDLVSIGVPCPCVLPFSMSLDTYMYMNEVMKDDLL